MSKHFVKFLVSDFLLDDAPRLGRPVEHDSNKIETLFEKKNQGEFPRGESICKGPVARGGNSGFDEVKGAP